MKDTNRILIVLAFCLTQIYALPFEDNHLCEGAITSSNFDWEWMEEQALSKLAEVEEIIKNVGKNDMQSVYPEIFPKSDYGIVKRDSGYHDDDNVVVVFCRRILLLLLVLFGICWWSW